MTDEAKRCVESCREWYQAFSNFGKGNERSVKELLTVADLIESLSAQLEQAEMERDGLNIMLAQAQAMLETRTKERDAAVRDILRECHKCKHFKVMFNGCTPDYDCEYSDVCEDGDRWQWRGVREVE